MDKRAVLALSLLLLLSLAFKLYYLDKAPFMEDESLYAVMIAEEAESPSFLPTYFGYAAPWKPGLYFLTYSLLLPVTSMLFSSPEWAYRFPNLLFSAASAFLVFLLARRFTSRDAAIFASLLFFSSITSFYVETRLLMEPMALTLILASLVFYTRKKASPADFLAAGALALLAALTKSVIALCIPLLALAYFWTRERSALRSPTFLLSLLGTPLGLAIFFLALLPTGYAMDIFLIDLGQAVVYDYSDSLGFALRNLSNIFGFLFLFLVAALPFFKKKQEAEPMLVLWALIILVPLLASTFRTWYLYYFLPPLSIFAASAIIEKGRADSFALLLLFAFVLGGMTVFSVSFAEWEGGTYGMLGGARELGISLAGDTSTLFVGSYYYNTVAICHKSIEERRVSGEPLDFGYILVRNPWEVEDYDAYVQAFAEDYYTDEYEVEDARYAQFFWNSTPFRKGTEIPSFRTIVSSPPLDSAPAGYALNYSDDYVAVYRKRE